MLERMIGVPMPRDEVFAAAERLLDRLDKVHRLLADPERSSVRIALNLEKLSIVEAQRSFTYFHLFGYPSDLVVCNRVLPSEQGRRRLVRGPARDPAALPARGHRPVRAGPGPDRARSSIAR